MVQENSTCNPTGIDLPPLCLQSMTQVQLENLVPKLVSQATGRTSSIFGTVSQKPDWWPKYIDWIDPDQLCLRYEDPCETLREIVRSCYQHCEKENLLHADNSFTRSMPSSPSSAESEMCVAEEATTAKPCNGSGRAQMERKEQNGEEKDHADVEDWKKLSETNKQKAENNDQNHEQDQRNKHHVTNKTIQKKETHLESNSQPIEIVGSDDEQSDTTPKQNQEKNQASGVSIESISPSIISEIDKHIMESIGSKFLNFTNLKPSGKKKGIKVNDMSLFENTVPEKSKFLGINLNGSSPEQSQKVSISELREMEVESKDKDRDVRSEDIEKDQQPHTGEAFTAEAAQKPEPLPSVSEDDDVVWICFLCAKGFSNQTDLMAHQEVCEDSRDVDDSATGSTESTVKSDSGQCKEKNMNMKTEKSKPNHSTSETQCKHSEPTLLTKFESEMKALPQALSTISRKCPSRKRKRNMEVYIPPPRETYFESLGLVPTPKVELIRTPQKTQNKDCQIIDLTLDEDKSPQSQPMTPRTHLIMAQLSREDSCGGRRRQLSFSQSSPPKLPKKVESDSESSDSSIEEPTRKRNVPCKSVILAIPLTSLLGQRLKKHWQSDNKIPVISDIESFCQTSNVQYDNGSLELERKSKFTEKLRHRPPPQVTFRFTKKYINKWFHKYKFNKADKKEFKHNLATGLECESRRLLRKMKKCKVSVERISKKEIKYWTAPRPKLLQQPSSSQPMRQNMYEHLRMRLRQPAPRDTRPLQLLNLQTSQSRARFPVAVPLFAQAQKLEGVPIPQFLVRNVPAGDNKVRMEIMPVVQRTFLPVSSTSLVMKTEKQKQAFHKPSVNSSPVICLSSDEEDDVETSPSCGKCQLPKTASVCSGKNRPKIGPASFMKHQQSLQQRAQMLRKSTNPNRNSPPVVNTGKADSVSARLFGKNSGKGGMDPNVSANQGSQPNATFNQVTKKPVETTVCSKDTYEIQGLDPNPSSGVCSSAAQESGFTHIRMVNGKIVNQVTGNSTLPGSQVGSAVQQPGSSVKQESNQASSDAEYMDFEVICIDSDEET